MQTSSSQASTIMLIDDHPMLRNGIKQLLTMNSELEVVAETSNGYEGLALAKKHDPDLILLDVNMPDINGLDTLKLLRENDVASRIIIFTVSDSEADVTTAMKLGADGYLLKDSEPEELLRSIEQVCLGKVTVSPELTSILVENLRTNRQPKPLTADSLTAREKQILRLIAQGMANKVIASKLNIAEGTVKVHVKHLLKKLNVRSRVEAAVWYHQQKTD